ncbi:MAG TPA: D-alanyl-D-alanine carboxypeptidase [Azospirillum sp.]|nr:D-alanyl-D-alanine carboxypeptidase [Azospirillum sp.]
MTATQRRAHTALARFVHAVRRSPAASVFWRIPVAALACATMLWSGPVLAARYEAIVIDARSGEVLHEHDADAPTPPASLTKMMTLYLVFDALDAGKLTLDQALPVSEYARAQSPTKLGLRAGSTIKVETAILGLVTKSANDAAVVLAEAIGGSESRFAEMMTRKGREVGMKHTVFRNANGLPHPEQVTTARDFAVLSQALLKDHPKYYPYFSRRNFIYGGRSIHNHNRLMSRYEGMDGIKTGYTVASGFNLAASAVRDGHRLIAVVMGGKSAVSRDNRMAALLDDSFARLRRGKGRDNDAPVVAQVAPPIQTAEVEEDEAPRPEPRAATVKKTSPPAKKAEPKPQSIGQLAAAVSGTPVAHSGGEGWIIQVGAFGSKEAGQKALAQASRKLPRLLGDAKPSVVEIPGKKGKVYRARLVGLDEKSARTACTQLQKTGHHCVAISPNDRT